MRKKSSQTALEDIAKRTKNKDIQRLVEIIFELKQQLSELRSRVTFLWDFYEDFLSWTALGKEKNNAKILARIHKKARRKKK